MSPINSRDKKRVLLRRAGVHSSRQAWRVLLVFLAFVYLYESSYASTGTMGNGPNRKEVTVLPDRISLAFEIPGDVIVLPSAKGDVVHLEGFVPGGSPGEPELPVYEFCFLLPSDVDPDSVTVALDSTFWVDISGRYNIAPVSPASTWINDQMVLGWGGKDLDDIVNGRDVTIYGSDDLFPPSPLEAPILSVFNTWRLAYINLRPVGFNPSTGHLLQLRSGTLIVSYKRPGLSAASPAVVTSSKRKKAWRRLASRVENANCEPAFYPPTGAEGRSASSPDAVLDYAVITTSYIAEHSEELAEFVAHKVSRGHRISIVTESPSAADDTHYLSGLTAEARTTNIRNWLIANQSHIEYALLIGSPDPSEFDSNYSVPMMKCYPDPNDHEMVPTDMCFTELSGNWDIDGDGFPGEFSSLVSHQDFAGGGIDRDCEVAVGRIPLYGVDTSDMTILDGILDKIVKYETPTGSQSWRHRLLIAAAISNHSPEDHNNDGDTSDDNEFGSGHRTFGGEWGEHMVSLCPDGYSTYTLLEQDGVYSDGSAYPLTYCDDSLTQMNLQSEWQRHYGFVVWWGHGSPWEVVRRVWDNDDTRNDHITQHDEETISPPFWGDMNCSSLDDAYPSFVVQVACQNAYPEAESNLSYSLLENGAIGAVGATRNSVYKIGAWSPTYSGTFGDNASYAYHMFDRMVNYGACAGDALNWCRTSFGTVWWRSSSWMNMLDFNVYGDPALTLLPPDSEPPTAISHRQASTRSTNIYVGFSEDMQESSMTGGNISVSGSSSGSHVCSFFFNHSTHEVLISPNTMFNYSETVTVTIGTGVLDLAGNGFASPYQFSFVIEDDSSVKFQVFATAIGEGSISPSGVILVSQGSDQEFTATPNPGYGVDTWYVAGQPVQTGGETYVLPNVQMSHSVYVTFRPFVAGAISLIAPQSGATWFSGRSDYITWDWEGEIGENVKIDLYKGGSLDSSIVAETANDGTYRWPIPHGQTEGSDYRVRISTMDGMESDYSDYFTITPPPDVLVPVPITSVTQLKQVCTGGLNAPYAHYKLMNDLDLSGEDNWDPIGSDSEHWLRGIFDGQNHTIRGVTIDRPTESQIGLFSLLTDSGSITNLNLEIEGMAGYSFVGGLVGECYGLISNCHVTLTDNLEGKGGGSIGGLAGYNDDSGRILGCSVHTSGNEVQAEGSVNGIGGLVGENAGLIRWCWTGGYVDASSSSKHGNEVGGIAGTNDAAGDIVECFSICVWVDGEDWTGGIVGLQNGGNVSDCYYSNGTVNGDLGVGGVAGKATGGTITRCYVTGSDDGNTYSGRLVGDHSGVLSDSFHTGTPTIGDPGGTVTNCHSKSDVELKQQATFTTAHSANWDFTDIWAIQEGVDFPKLRGVGSLLSAPTGLTASNDQSNGVHVSWNAVTYDLAGSTHNAVYRVYRSDSTDTGAPKVELGSWQAGQSFVDDTAAPEATYYYWVKAAATTAGARESGFSAVASGLRTFPPADTPTGVSATDGLPDSVMVQWQGAANANFYRVYRTDGVDTPAPEDALGSWQTDLVYTDVPPEEDIEYFYWVVAAVDDTGGRASGFGGPDAGHYVVVDDTAPSVTLSLSPGLPVETQNVELSVSASDNRMLNRIVLHWNDGADHSQTWDEIGSSSTEVSHDTGPYAAGVTIDCWAEAWDTAENRAESDHRSVTVSCETVSTPSRPAGPAFLTAGQSGTYSTGSSTTSLGGAVEYLFDWNGSQSSWDGASRENSWGSDGYYFVKAKARSQVNSSRESNWSNSLMVTVDSVSPTVGITTNGGSDFTTDLEEVVLEGTCGDGEPSSGIAEVSLNTGDTNEGTWYNWRFSVDLSEGPNTFVVSARDYSGNVGTAEITVTRQVLDGSVVAWGSDQYHECSIAEPNEGYVGLATGFWYSLGLRADGSVSAWGRDVHGECAVPEPNSDFVAVGAGWWHSLGLKSDGSVVAWGLNTYAQCDIPQPNTGFVALAGGVCHSLGLKGDGAITAWGWNDNGQCNVPTPNADFVALAAGHWHSLGLKANGSVVAWGANEYGQCSVPSPNDCFVDLACGAFHSLGLKADGSIAAWGRNDFGQCNVPEPNADFIAVASGGYHSLGMKADGSILGWGRSYEGQCNSPEPHSCFTLMSAGGYHSVALRRNSAGPVVTRHPAAQRVYSGSTSLVSVRAVGTLPLSYQWRKGSVGIPGATGSGYIIGSAQAGHSGNYDCLVWNSAGSTTSLPIGLTVSDHMQLNDLPSTKYGYIGDSHTFSVTPTAGFAPYNYQWRKGQSVVGTDAAYVIPAIGWTDAGRYSVEVADSLSDVLTSPEAILYVQPHVRFDEQPANAKRYVGQSHTMAVSVSGGYAPVSCQWWKGLMLLGTGTSHVIPALTVADSGQYWVRASDSRFDTTTTTPAKLEVAEHLQITAQPQTGNRYTGDSLTLSAGTAKGHLPLSYSWRKGVTQIGTNSSFTFSSLTPADTGWYSAVIRDAGLDVLETVSTPLTVRGHVVISAQPQGAEKYVGGAHSFRVTANGGYTPFTYTWKKGLTTVGSGALLELTNLQQADTGNYMVYVKDTNTDNVPSNKAVLIVKPHVFFTAMPQGAKVPTGASHTFTAGVNGGYPPYSYTWYKGANVVGYDATYTVPVMSLYDQGWYKMKVVDKYGDSRFSASARLVMQAAKAGDAPEEPLYITKHPVGGTVPLGGAISLAVEAMGGVAPLDYTWKHADVVVGDEAAITLRGLTPDDSGDYVVEVNDAAKQIVVSNAATIEVTSQGVPVAGIGGIALLVVSIAYMSLRKKGRKGRD